MPRKTFAQLGIHTVRLRLSWPKDKWDTIKDIAEHNGRTVSEMVDIILDDWSIRAGREVGITKRPTILVPHADSKIGRDQ